MESSGASSLEAIVQQPGGVVRLHLAWFHRLWVCRSAFDIRQETRDYPQQGQQGADPKDEFDAGLVGQPAEEGRAEAAEAEHQHRAVLRVGGDAADHFAGAFDHFLNDDAFKPVEQAALVELGDEVAVFGAKRLG